MTLDRVTSLADLAFKGKKNKYYRQLAILVADYYGKSDVTWKDAINYLQEIAIQKTGEGCCVGITENANLFRGRCRETFVERPEQLDLTLQPKKKVVSDDGGDDYLTPFIDDCWYDCRYTNLYR